MAAGTEELGKVFHYLEERLDTHPFDLFLIKNFCYRSASDKFHFHKKDI